MTVLTAVGNTRTSFIEGDISSRSDSWTNSSECGKGMNFCLVVVYVIENNFSYGPNLKIEIGGNCSHFKNGGRWISIKYFKHS